MRTLHIGSTIALIGMAFVGCSSETRSVTQTRYLVSADLEACVGKVADDADYSRKIGDLTYREYGLGELVCAEGADGQIQQTFVNAKKPDATHQWRSKTGTNIVGSIETFGPVEQ